MPPADPSDPNTPSQTSASSRHIRGSSLLLFGRVIAMVVNFLVQVLVVRYLSTAEYGAFAYALSFVALGELLVTLGIDRSLGRFLPIYQERGEWPKVFGAIALVAGTILSLGLALILLVVGVAGTMGTSLVDDDLAITLIVILVFLAPIQAADTMFTSILAVFASPRAIFFRRYVLSPVLRLAVVGLLKHLDVRRLDLPVREILFFTLPLLSTDLLFVLMNTTDVLLLGAYHGVEEVAAWRVVQPLAGLNQLVMSSFALLFVPAAARLFARRELDDMRDLYWQTAIWMAVSTFPIFIVTFALAEPVTVLLYEPRYASSAILLSLLALARYVDVVFGFNGLTLRVFGDMRAIVAVNVFVAVVNLGLNLVLIPRYGALGAAVGTASTLIVYNIAKQVALARATPLPAFEPRYLRVYVVIAVTGAVCFALQMAVRPPLLIGLAMAAAASLIVLLASRDQLRLGQTFPELMRLPFARLLVGGTGPPDPPAPK